MTQPRRVPLLGPRRSNGAAWVFVTLIAVVLLAGFPASCSNGDAVFAQAFADRAEDLPVEGLGTVTRLLADDSDGGRHQRFIVRLGSGQTLLIVHNIDVAPRVASLKAGDTVEFKGEYVWNEQGGLVHWTHRDPETGRAAGWIRHEGRVYE